MPEMFECPNCGAPIERSSTQCPYCEVALYTETATSSRAPTELISNAQWAKLPAALQDIGSSFNEMVTTAVWSALRREGHGEALDQLVQGVLAIGARVMALPKYAKVEASDPLDLSSRLLDFLEPDELWIVNLAADLVAWAPSQAPDNLFLLGSSQSSKPLRDRLHEHHERKLLAKIDPPDAQLAALRSALPSSAPAN